MFFSCTNNDEDSSLFELMPVKHTNLNFNNKLEENSKVREFGYASVAVGDLNNDGYQDIAMSNLFEGVRIFLNKGDLVFEDITPDFIIEKCLQVYGINIADINSDGFADLYMCMNNAEVECPNNKDSTTNIILLNNGDLTFLEVGDQNPVEHKFSFESNFFNYDNDGLPDLFLMKWTGLGENPFNFKVINDVNNSNYYNTINKNYSSGFKNINTKAIGLNAFLSNSNTIADFDNNGKQDIFLGKDFLLQDELFLANDLGEFKNQTKKFISNTSMFSMGSDAADINNDGYLDLISLDMLAHDHYRRKLSTLFYASNFHEMLNKIQLPQYQRNVVQINRNGKYFSEVGFALDLAATDWSWSAIFADFDLDGFKDLYVSNGIRKDLTNMDYVANYLNERTNYNIIDEWKFNWDNLPDYKISNYIFKNIKGKQFKNVTNEWGLNYSANNEGAAYADFDLDGDLDIIVNNVDELPFLFKNKTIEKGLNNYIRITLSDTINNQSYLGTRVYVFNNSEFQMIEISNARGYLSVSEPVANFGVGKSTLLDSIVVVWPNNKVSSLNNVATNKIINVDISEAYDVKKPPFYVKEKTKIISEEITISPTFEHKEEDFNDFKYERLIPWKISQEGPVTSTGDINSDGLEDFIVGGAKNQPIAIYIQQPDKSFKSLSQPVIEEVNAAEVVELILEDFDNDNDLDLYIGSGSNEAQYDVKVSKDFILLNDGNGIFSKHEIDLPVKNFFTGGAASIDLNQDGFSDLVIGERNVPGNFGAKTDNNYVLVNNGDATFRILEMEALKALNFVTDIESVDFDNDGDEDLIVVGEFSAPILLENVDKQLIATNKLEELKELTGLWRSISVADLNGDDIPDFVLGNLGINTILKASNEEKIELLVNDFDENGSLDPIITHYLEHVNAPFADKDLFCSQMPYYNNVFNDYESYARAKLEDIFTKPQLNEANKYEVSNLNSIVIYNYIDSFKVQNLPFNAQFSPVNDAIAIDVDTDGDLDIITTGNSSSFHYSQGNLLANSFGFYVNNDGQFEASELENYAYPFKVINSVSSIELGRDASDKAIILGINNGPLSVIKPRIKE